jgi:hypothetical protein
MKLTDIENRVRQIPWPAPPEPLRARVLSSATIAPEQITWSDRVWFSRPARLSALATALIFVAFELQSSTTRPAEPAPTPQALAEARGIEDFGRQAGLPADVVASLARRALTATAIPRGGTQEWTDLAVSAPAGDRR